MMVTLDGNVRTDEGAAAAVGELPEDDGLPEDEPKDGNNTVDNFREEIAGAEADCTAAEVIVNDTKTALKEAKEEYDGAVRKLRQLARAMQNDQDRPLFDGIKDKDNQGEGEDDDSNTDADSEACLGAEIGVLELRPNIVAKLKEAGVYTINDLETLRKEIYLGQAKWPKGIGPAKVTKIKDVVVSYIAENYQDKTEEETEVDDDGEKDEDD